MLRAVALALRVGLAFAAAQKTCTQRSVYHSDWFDPGSGLDMPRQESHASHDQGREIEGRTMANTLKKRGGSERSSDACDPGERLGGTHCHAEFRLCRGTGNEGGCGR